MISLFRKTRGRAFTFTAFIALIWLNQSVGGKDWDAFREAALSAPREHIVNLLRYPFVFLYRRAADEALYFATASAVLGRPYDASAFDSRGDSPLPQVRSRDDGHIHWPYAEIPFEYPPPNVPVIVAPRLLATSFRTYAWLFGALMGLLLLCSARIGARIGADADGGHREAARIVAFGLLLLAHGSIAIQRLDALAALLVILMVRAAARGDDRSLGFWGGLVGATKFLPIVVLPATVLAAAIRDKRRLGSVTLFAVIGLVLGLAPMVLLGGGDSLALLLEYHSARGLHVESTLGVLYGATKLIAKMPEVATLDYGSYNFHGGVSEILAKLSPIVLLALGGIIAVAAARGAPPSAALGQHSDDSMRRTERIVFAALAMLIAMWLSGKVFSPQYLTWALPLCIALPRRSWPAATLGLGSILVVSQIYFRGYYDHVYNQWPLGVMTMVLRLGLLFALFAWCVNRLLSSPSTQLRGRD